MSKGRIDGSDRFIFGLSLRAGEVNDVRTVAIDFDVDV